MSEEHMTKLEGIVQAIEGEAKAPAPSHANLARLTAMFCRTFIEALNEPVPSRSESASWPVGAPPAETITTPLVDPSTPPNPADEAIPTPKPAHRSGKHGKHASK